MTRGRANVLPPLALVSTVVLLWAATQSHVAAFAPANPASLPISSRIQSSKTTVVRQRVVVPSLGEQAAARGKQLNIPRLALSAHNHGKNRGRHVLLQATSTSSYQAVEDSAEEKEDRRAYRQIFDGTVATLGPLGDLGEMKITGDCEDLDEIPFAWAAFGGGQGLDADVVLADPPNAATNLTNADQVKGKIVAVMRGGTPFLEKARIVQSAGAIGLIIINTDDELLSPGGGEEGADITIPVVMLKAKDGRAFGAEGAGDHASFPAKAQPAVTEGGASEELPLIILSQPLFPGEVAELRGSDLREAEKKIKIKAGGGEGGRFLVGYAPKGKVAEACCVAEIQEPPSSSSPDAIEPPLKIIGVSRAKLSAVKPASVGVAASLPDIGGDDTDHKAYAVLSTLPLPPRKRQLALDCLDPSLRLSASRHAVRRASPPHPLPEPLPPLQGRSVAAAVASKVIPATVRITPTLLRNTTARGTGFIVSDHGIVVTNAHVAGLTTGIKCSLNDGSNRVLKGRLIGRDRDYDLAVVRLEGLEPGEKLPTVQLAVDSDVQVGETAVSIGNPSEWSNVVTMGVVSGLPQNSRGEGSEGSWGGGGRYLLTDASLSPGMSGGPLCNDRGEVMGVNTLIRGDMNGMGMCVTAGAVREALDDMLGGGSGGTASAAARCEVVLHNDGMNSRVRVAALLKDVAGLNDDAANAAMMDAHKGGQGIVGRYAREEAEKLGEKLSAADLLIEVRPCPDDAE